MSSTITVLSGNLGDYGGIATIKKNLLGLTPKFRCVREQTSKEEPSPDDHPPIVLLHKVRRTGEELVKKLFPKTTVLSLAKSPDWDDIRRQITESALTTPS